MAVKLKGILFLGKKSIKVVILLNELKNVYQMPNENKEHKIGQSLRLLEIQALYIYIYIYINGDYRL